MSTQRERSPASVQPSRARVAFRVRVHPKTRLEYIGTACREVFGYTSDELMTEPRLAERLICPEDRARFGSEPASIELGAFPTLFRIRRKDGQPGWVQTLVKPVRDSQGMVVAVEGVAEDVTAVVDGPREYSLGRLEMEEFIETVPYAIISIDASQRITFFNHGAVAIFGYREDEVIGKPIDMLLPARLKDAHWDHVREFLDSPDRARHKDARLPYAACEKMAASSPRRPPLLRRGKKAASGCSSSCATFRIA